MSWAGLAGGTGLPVPGRGDLGRCRPVTRSGHGDTLVNKAGVYISKPFTDYTAEDYALMVGVNLTGFFWLTQRAITEVRPWPGMTGWPTVGPHASSQEVSMAVAFPGESAEYRAARDQLLDQEIELRRAMEAVAEARRRLPPGGVVPEDYVFQGRGPGGAPARVRLSELFAPGKNSLVIYSMMFPRAADDTSPGPPGGETALLPLAEGPCPSCTALLDQLDGAAGHAAQHVNLVVAAKAPLERVLTFAAERGWRRLRLLSSADSTYNRDYLAETADGAQQPMLNVFHREGRAIRHFWGSELFYAPADQGQEPRHVGTIEPLWNLFDLTREGRPADWHERFSY